MAAFLGKIMARLELDLTDHRILAILQEEGRISNAALADRVELSPSPCLRRVQRLEREGLILGYHAEVAAQGLGLELEAMVRVNLDRKSIGEVERFRAAIEEWPEVVECWSLTGEMDYLARVLVANLEDFNLFVMKRLLTFEGLRDVRTSFVLEAIKRRGTLKAPDRPT